MPISTSAISASLRPAASIWLHVVESAHPARDVAGWQRLSFQRLDDADDVDDLVDAALVDSERLDHSQGQFLGLQSKERRAKARTVLGVDRQAEAAALREHEERDRMQRQDRSRRKHRPLHALLPALGDEGANVGELAELGLVDAGLPSRRQWRPDLRDHQADFAGRDLHPGMFLDAVDGPDANRQSRHQQVGLIPGFAMKRDGTALRASGSPAANHQSHFVGTDAMNRQERDE